MDLTTAGEKGYKAPRRRLVAQAPLRASNGKADDKAVTGFARRDLGLAS